MRAPELALRVALIVGSALAVNQHPSTWVAAPLGLIAIAATVELAIRPYGRNAIDRLLMGCGSVVVALILIGVGLNLTPSGLTRMTWTAAWVVLGLGVLIWRRKYGLTMRLSRIGVSPSAFWAVPIVLVLVAAGFVAQGGVRNGEQPVLALALISKSAHVITVQIDASSITGTYRLKAHSEDPGAKPYVSGEFAIDASGSGAHIVKRIPIALSGRWTITLASATSTLSRQLIVDIGSAAASWIDIWRASFAGRAFSRVRSTDWQYVTGSGFGDGEVESMTDLTQNVHIDGHGDLVITALRNNGAWTSSRLQSKDTFLFAPGGEYRVSASIMQPNPQVGTGYWPAFWMLAPGTPQHTGEIDVLESVNGDSDHGGNLHCGYDRRNANRCQARGLGSGLLPCPHCQDSFHTYSVIVDRRFPGAEQISFYLDGNEFWSTSESAVGATAWTSAFTRPFDIILEVAIGGQYPDSRCNCHSPLPQTSPGASMQVQYVAVSKLAG